MLPYFVPIESGNRTPNLAGQNNSFVLNWCTSTIDVMNVEFMTIVPAMLHVLKAEGVNQNVNVNVSNS